MLDYLERLFSAEGFMPHGMCYLWQPDILSLHVVSDAFIALAYFSIPIALLYFARRRRDLQFSWMFVCFAVFIIACGTTHLMEIVTIWTPVYWLSGIVKAITAFASVPTAFLLVKLLPDALRVQSPAILRQQLEIHESSELAVRRAKEALEVRVIERTAELEAANRQLREEIRQRQRAEDTLHSSRKLLDAIVESTGAVIYAKDLAGKYLLTNRRFDDSLVLKRGEILGRTDFDLFASETAQALREFDQRVVAGGVPVTAEEAVPLSDGEHVFVSVKTPLIDGAGNVHGMFGVSTDITERKRTEELRKSQLEHLNLLERILHAIAGMTNPADIHQIVLRHLEESLRIDLACFCKREGEQFLVVTSVGPNSQPLANRLVLEDGARLTVDDESLAKYTAGELVNEANIATLTSRFPERLAQAGLRSLVLAPQRVEQKVVGVLLCARREAGSFANGECEFLRQLIPHVTLASHGAQQHALLKQAYEELKAAK